MRRAMMAAMAVLLAAGGAIRADEPPKGYWKTFAEALKAAQPANKPMFLFFAGWTAEFKKYESVVFASDEVSKALAGYVCAYIEYAGPQAKFNKDLLKRFGMDGRPAGVMVMPDGALLNGWVGYNQTRPVSTILNHVDTGNRALEEYRAFLKEASSADKRSYDWQLKALTTYTKFQKWDAAAAAAKEIRRLDPRNAKDDAAQAGFAAYKNALASGANDQQIRPFLDEVRKFDPKNEKGLLEKTLADYADSLRGAGNSRGQIEVLKELTAKAEKLTDGVRVYEALGDALQRANDLKGAVAAYEKALETSPDSPRAEVLKADIDTLKKRTGGAK